MEDGGEVKWDNGGELSIQPARVEHFLPCCQQFRVVEGVLYVLIVPRYW